MGLGWDGENRRAPVAWLDMDLIEARVGKLGRIDSEWFGPGSGLSLGAESFGKITLDIDSIENLLLGFVKVGSSLAGSIGWMEKVEDFNLESGSGITDSEPKPELGSRNELRSGRMEWLNLLVVCRVGGEPGKPFRVCWEVGKVFKVDSELVFKIGWEVGEEIKDGGLFELLLLGGNSYLIISLLLGGLYWLHSFFH